MILNELKQYIELNTLTTKCLVAICEDETSNFLFYQYAQAYTKQNNITINFIDSIYDANTDTGVLNIYICDELDIDTIPDSLIWIRCTSVIDNTTQLLSPYIVTIPKLELWQIKDYVYTLCEGIKQKDLDYLVNKHNTNLYALNNTIDKLTIFDTPNKVYLNIKSQIFDEKSKSNIVELVTALIKYDIITLTKILLSSSLDIDIFEFITILHDSFKNVIDMQLSNNSNNLVIKDDKQPLINIYSRKQLLKIYEFITHCEYDILCGYIDVENALDYIIAKIITTKEN